MIFDRQFGSNSSYCQVTRRLQSSRPHSLVQLEQRIAYAPLQSSCGVLTHLKRPSALFSHDFSSSANPRFLRGLPQAVGHIEEIHECHTVLWLVFPCHRLSFHETTLPNLYTPSMGSNRHAAQSSHPPHHLTCGGSEDIMKLEFSIFLFPSAYPARRPALNYVDNQPTRTDPMAAVSMVT